MIRRATLSARVSSGIAIICGLVAVAVRMPAVLRAHLAFDSDNALGPLMSLAILRDGYRPLMLDGQDYLGALDAWLCAPLAWALGPAPWFWAVGQTALLAVVVVPLCCALGGRVGGTWGALAAGLVVAGGAAESLILTTCAPLGYLTNLAFGVLALLLATADEPLTPRRLASMGLVAGAGVWNSPQFAVFALPAALSIWSRSALAHLRSGPTPSSALRGAFALVPWVALLAVMAVLAVPFASDPIIEFGPFRAHANHVNRYLSEIACALVVWAVVGELVYSRDRAQVVRGAVAFAIGGAVGAGPLLAYRIWGIPAGVAPHLGLHPAAVLEHVGSVRRGIAATLTGSDGLGVSFGVALAVLALAWTQCHGRALLGLALLGGRNTVSLPHPAAVAQCASGSCGLPVAVTAVAPAFVVLSTMLLRGPFLSGPRHYLGLLVPAGALVAWGTASCARRSRLLAAGLLALLVVRAWVGAVDLPGELDRRACPERSRLLAWLDSRGLRHGYGQYWVAFELTLLARGALLLACDHDPVLNNHRFRGWDARVRWAPGDRVVVLALSWPANDQSRLPDVHDTYAGRLWERRAFGGRYVAFAMERER